MDFVLVSREECEQSSANSSSGERQNMYAKLEKDLVAQAKMCERNQQYFQSTGDVASANKCMQQLEHTKKDLDALRFAFKRKDPVPRFHYEHRAFSKIVCNAELTDMELEVTVVKGINYGVQNPKEVATYCK